MEVYILGYGGWISQATLGYTSIYVKTDINLLIDVGECTYFKMTQCGLPWPDVVFISHRHGDHILGIPTFLLLARKLNRRLKIVASAEVIEAVKTLASVTAVEKSLNFVDFLESTRDIQIGKTHFKFVNTSHLIFTQAVRIEYADKCFVYSSDTAPSREVEELARGCDLLAHEVSGNPGQEEEAHKFGHSTTLDAVEIAKRAGVKMLMPIHFYTEQPLISSPITIVLPTPCGRVVI